MHLRRNATQSGRRGIVLLIVLAMLTLFAIAGLTFVLYADAASESARINRGAETAAAGGLPDMDPTAAFNLFMGQLIYGVTDPTTADQSGAETALRGHSLAETMYGSYDSQGAVPSDVPYNGTGRLRFTYPANSPGASANQQEYNMVNYTYFPSDGFLHDPGRYGARTDPTQPRAPYVGGQNAPYTYPDVNSMFLATINPNTASGVSWITTPSYSVRGNPTNHYATMRPVGMARSFPAPDANGRDVQNLPGPPLPPGTPPLNDSIWIDIGAPELTTANGIRYKMLVAPLILDLDSCINLNVAGNVLATPSATANAHASNQGLGPWEVNISKVLNADLSPTAPATEWQNLFLGNGTLSRYGPGHLPLSFFPLNGLAPHVYAQVDLDGLKNLPAPGGSVTGSGGTGPYSIPPAVQGYFPSFDPNAYLNGQTQEHQNAGGAWNHPMYYNPLTPAAGNHLLLLDAFAPFLWAGVNASSPTTSLRALCPTNFVAFDQTSGTARRIHETTVLSMDVDWPGASPYTWDSSPANAAYTLPAPPSTQLYPSAPGGNTFPAALPPIPPAVAPPVPPGSDFNATTYRSTLSTLWSTLGRCDLNRTLAAYPANGIQPPDRQQFAQDIFNRLTAVTGMAGVAANPSAATVTQVQYNALRWLAQLSANIVDYIDSDDVMTVFQWTTAPNASFNDNGYVFGTELPKLVVNEVYLEYDNDPTDPAGMTPAPNPKPKATKPYQMNVWAELMNPLPSGVDLNGANVNNANLVDANGNPIYQLVITSPNTHLRDANNILGDPDSPNPPPPVFAPQPYQQTATPLGTYSTAVANSGVGQVMAVVKNWGGVQSVTPVGTTQNITPAANASQGFFVIGPQNPPLLANATPTQPATSQTQIQTSVTATNMTYTIANNDTMADTPPPPTILLQRLANPHLPWSATPGAGYNPYVTVDYVEMDKVKSQTNQPVINDARLYNANGQIAAYDPNPNHRYSVGRNQPYGAAVAAGTATWQKQQAPAAPPLTANQPTTTFFAINAGAAAATPPDWLVHLDRPLISPTELLQVSAFKPHELTQQFEDKNGNHFAHRAPWTTDQNARLYRLFEFVKASNPTPGLMPAGRVPGKVNINTVDPNAVEVFRALCDAEPGNSFYNSTGGPTDANVDQAFAALMAARNANGGTPFRGMAMGAYSGTDAQYPGAGVANTLLALSTAPTVAGQLALTPNAQASAHPYQQTELLNKLFSNLTTRSNVFAVWLTVGFFQVTNDQALPIQLGAEINKAQNKNIRHHMFAIVDRTQLQTFSTNTLTGTNIVPGATPVNISIPPTVTDPRTGRTWTVAQGSVLVYEPNTANEETVLVGAGGATAIFTKSHTGVVPVVSRGNPGPWHLAGSYPYDVSQDNNTNGVVGANGVVPYYRIID